MTRLLHTADTHLGYRQYHEEARRQDFLEAFQSVLADAREQEVDAVVHAGDLFHDRRPELADVLGAVDALRTLREAGIPFLAVVGNHEGTRSAQWIDLFERLELAERLDDGGRVVGETTLYGLDYTPASKRPALEYAFSASETPYATLVSHGAFEPFAYGTWDLEEILESAPVEFDVVLLGDNHAPERETVSGIPAVYAGSTERASAEERDPRGYNLVSFEDGVAVRRRGIDTRKFVFVDIELGPDEGTERVCERVREEDPTDAVLVVTITGNGDRVVPADVEGVGDEAGALVTRVNDRRERESTDETTVSFADPDAAVKDRLAQRGLSEVARDIDELVRDDQVADSNLRERVKRRVEDADQDDLEPVPDPSGGTGSDEDTSPSDGEPEADDEEGDTPIPTEGGETSEDSEESQVTMEDYL